MTSYREAGVDVDAKDDVLQKLRKKVVETFTEDVVSAPTSFKFGGALSLKRFMEFKNPVLVLSTDGAGTKTMIAEKMNKFDTIGTDVLNHCINDVLTSGAKTFFFLDYVASAKLKPEIVAEIVGGIAKECKRQGIVLAGGETAEMPGVYREGRHDVAGTAGGIVERDNLIDGSNIKEGDVLLGLPSSGLHTNGYSLARKVLFEDNKYDCSDEIRELNGTLGKALLATHKEYASLVLPLVEKKFVKGIVHLTGGGFPGNVPRIMPKDLGSRITKGSWPVLPIFNLIQEAGGISTEEMFRTFNMGIGMILVVDEEKKTCVLDNLKGEKVYEIGRVIRKEGVEYAAD